MGFLDYVKRCWKGEKSAPVLSGNIIPRSEHPVSRKKISKAALKVLYGLHEAGFSAYLVGGCLRDIFLNREPKDFDVVTDAKPEEIRRLFRNCFLIGRRFRIAHVRFGREIIEVSTFRSGHDANDKKNKTSAEGLILRDNEYGTIDQDIWRRDLTVNALYYNIADFSLVDYTQGVSDLKAGVLRMIGDPKQRYREDPVRILRVIRFLAKLKLTPDSKTVAPIPEMREHLLHIAPARLFLEVEKLFLSGHAIRSYQCLRDYNIFSLLFPAAHQCLESDASKQVNAFIEKSLNSTDQRFASGKPVAVAFLLAALLWYPLMEETEGNTRTLFSPKGYDAMDVVLSKQVKRLAIPKRISAVIREIWSLQSALERKTSRRAERLLQHPRFRAAYDFLLLRAEVDPRFQAVAQWWTDKQLAEMPESDYQKVDDSSAYADKPAPRRRRRRRNYRRRDDAKNNDGDS